MRFGVSRGFLGAFLDGLGDVLGRSRAGFGMFWEGLGGIFGLVVASLAGPGSFWGGFMKWQVALGSDIGPLWVRFESIERCSRAPRERFGLYLGNRQGTNLNIVRFSFVLEDVHSYVLGILNPSKTRRRPTVLQK